MRIGAELLANNAILVPIADHVSELPFLPGRRGTIVAVAPKVIDDIIEQSAA